MAVVSEEYVVVNGLFSRAWDARALGYRGVEIMIARWLDGGLILSFSEAGFGANQVISTRLDNTTGRGRLWRFPIPSATFGMVALTGTWKNFWIRFFDEPVAPYGIMPIEDDVTTGIAPAASTGLFGSYAIGGLIKNADVWVMSTQAGVGSSRFRFAVNWPQSVASFTTVANVPLKIHTGLKASLLDLEWTNGGGVNADFYYSILGVIG